MGDTNMLTCTHACAYTLDYYSATKRTKQRHPSNMDGPTQSHTEEERQIPSDTTDTWNLKYDTNEHTDKIEADSQTKTTDLCSPTGRQTGKAMEWESGVSR